MIGRGWVSLLEHQRRRRAMDVIKTAIEAGKEAPPIVYEQLRKAPEIALRQRAFTMAVIRAAEQERYRLETALAMLRAAGFTAVAGLAVPFVAWASVHAEPLQTGMLGAAALFVVVALVRRLSSRVTTVLRN